MTNVIVAAGQLSGNGNDECDSSKEQAETKNRLGNNKTISFLTAQKMINRFLTCDRKKIEEIRCLRYTKEELAKKLGITSRELEKLKTQYFYKSIVNRINLSLASTLSI